MKAINYTLTKETEKAMNIRISLDFNMVQFNSEIWVPKSQVELISENKMNVKEFILDAKAKEIILKSGKKDCIGLMIMNEKMGEKFYTYFM